MAILVCAAQYGYSIIVFVLSFIIPANVFDYKYNHARLKDDLTNWIRSACVNVWKKLKKLWPHAWPKDNLPIQLLLLFSLFTIVAVRYVRLLIPLCLQRIVDSLEQKVFCVDLILLYALYDFINDVFWTLQDFIWTPVEQHISKQIQTKVFSHLHNLSLRWHLGRKTGEVLKVMNRGSESINGIISYFLQTFIPSLFDVIVSVLFLSYSLDWYFGIIAIFAMIVYLRVTTKITDWESEVRESLNTNRDEQVSHSIDTLFNYETVKYYVAEKFETSNYTERIERYQKDELKLEMSYQVLEIVQTMIINMSLVIGSIYCAYLVAYSNLTTGQYVLLSTYVLRIFYPLQTIGSCYKEIQKHLSDMQKTLDLLDVEFLSEFASQDILN